MLAERYRIVKEIGRGASSLVFYAEDMLTMQEDGTPMPVALKILDKDSNEYKINSRSFKTETRAVVDIPTNSHTVAVQDVSYDYECDVHFIVMEYVKGTTLRRYMSSHGSFAPREIVSIALQVLDALRNAHESGVIHRDVKPQNILVQSPEDAGHVKLPGGRGMPYIKLADFGIALLPDEDLFAMTDRGVGTVHYISPEQAGGGSIDARSDIYSLGVVMYELATGRVPFDAESATAVITKHQTNAPMHARAFNPAIPLSLDSVIFCAMQKDPHHRFKDAAAMERKLREVLRELSGAENTEAESIPAERVHTPRAKRPVPRGVWIGAAATALVALLVVGAVLLIPLIGDAFGGDKLVEVPQLVGSKYEEDSVYPEGIIIGNVTYENSRDVAEGMILSQSEAGGKQLKGPVTIHLVVSLGPKMLNFDLPTEYRTDYATAKKYLEDTYTFLMVDRSQVEEYDASLGEQGAVIGAIVTATGEPLPLTDGEIPDTTFHIILKVNGEAP
jgi:serine/threonine-protein kinase